MVVVTESFCLIFFFQQTCHNYFIENTRVFISGVMASCLFFYETTTKRFTGRAFTFLKENHSLNLRYNEFYFSLWKRGFVGIFICFSSVNSVLI